MTTFRIALANLRFPLTREESVELSVQAIRDAAAEGAGIVCFPEGYVPGYRAPGKDVASADQAFLARAWDEIAAAAGEANIAVVLGTERFVDSELLLTALVIDRDGTTLGFQDKMQIDPSEEPTYGFGSGRQVFETDGLTFGVAICHEGWRYPETVRWAAKRGAQVVFHPHFHDAEPGSYRPTSFGDPANSFHETALRARAAENACYIASVNVASEGSPTTSIIVRPDGTVLAWQPYGEEGLLVADVDLDAATGLYASRLREG